MHDTFFFVPNRTVVFDNTMEEETKSQKLNKFITRSVFLLFEKGLCKKPTRFLS